MKRMSISDEQQSYNPDGNHKNDPNWAKNNLEYDLRTTEWILEKVRNDYNYAVQLYSALCNNEWCKKELFEMIKGDYWSCSWRYAGGIVAHMQKHGTYMNFYAANKKNFSEGQITEVIAKDLEKLGWMCVESTDEII